MKLEQSFTVTAPVEQVWTALVDVERIAPCLPGAEITGQSPDGGYEGTFTVKLGPATASYRGSLKMESLDEAARVATMSAKGTDKRGQGGATASIVSTMRQDGDDTQVDVVTDFTITGRLARFGRGGMIEDISKRLMRDFANCLQATLAADPAAAPAAEAAAPAEEAAAAAATAGGAAAGEPPAASGAAAEAPSEEAADEAAARAPSEEAAPSEAAARAPSEPAADEAAAGAPLPGEDAAEAEPAASTAAEAAAAEPDAPAAEEAASAPPGADEPAAAAAPDTAASLPGEAAAEAEEPPVRRAGEADPFGPLSPPAEPAVPPEEPAAPRTHSIPPPSAAARPQVQPAKPVKGFSLLFGVLWDRVKAFFGRLFGRGKK
jgi:carbon monoxide dehydrogenase subunit G